MKHLLYVHFTLLALCKKKYIEDTLHVNSGNSWRSFPKKIKLLRTCDGEEVVWVSVWGGGGHWNPVEPAGGVGCVEGGVRTGKDNVFSGCGGRSLSGGVPEGLEALRPWTGGWPCRSTPPAGGSTPPRLRCSPAGPRAGRPRPGRPPGAPLDLRERETGCEIHDAQNTYMMRINWL